MLLIPPWWIQMTAAIVRQRPSAADDICWRPFVGILTKEGIDWLGPPPWGGETVMYWMKVRSWQVWAAGLQRVKTTSHSPFTLGVLSCVCVCVWPESIEQDDRGFQNHAFKELSLRFCVKMTVFYHQTCRNSTIWCFFLLLFWLLAALCLQVSGFF